MSQQLKQLSERHGDLLAQADKIIKTAIAENRDLNSSESEKLGGLKSQIFTTNRAEVEERNRISMMTGTRPGEHRNSGGIDMDLSNYSICRAIRMMGGEKSDGFELEVSQEIAHRSGRAPNGIFVPHSALIERRAGMSVTQDGGSFGSYTVASEVRGLLEALRPRLACAMAGATLMSGLTSNIGLPRHKAASTASFKGEIAELSEATPEIEQLLLTPKRVGAFTKYSKQLVVQSSPDIERFVKNDLLDAVAIAIDAAALAGTGTGDQPRGILSTAGIGSVAGGTNGLAPSYAHLLALVSAVATANALAGRPGFIFSTKVEAKLRGTLMAPLTESLILSEGQTTLAGQPWMSSNNSPDNLTKGTSSGVCSAIVFGNFEDLVLASFGDGLDLVVDPFSLATSGQVRVVINAFADVGVRRAASFSAMKDALTA